MTFAFAGARGVIFCRTLSRLLMVWDSGLCGLPISLCVLGHGFQEDWFEAKDLVGWNLFASLKNIKDVRTIGLEMRSGGLAVLKWQPSLCSILSTEQGCPSTVLNSWMKSKNKADAPDGLSIAYLTSG